jgi:superfamily II DNA/RNA helicase
VAGLEINLVIPDLWQQEAVRALREGRDVIVDAPTGAGKTYIFELLHPELREQAIYTVPTRALANDKLAEWQRRGWNVGIATGDVALRLDAKVLVATLETQKGKLLRGIGPRLLVIDEYQMLADPTRGVNYEIALALAPPQTQLLLLSGSVANPSDVADWLRRIGRDAVLVSHRERPVPLEEVDLLSLPDSAGSRVTGFWPRAVTRALRAGLGPILVFAPRRNAAEELAQRFSASLPPDAPLPLSPEQELLAGPALATLLKNRVAYHHSGMSYALRAGLVEPLAKNGHLRVVVATMGLAAGINFSMRSVLVTDTRYMAGDFERQVRPDELLQMFGRAGRRGLDKLGYVLTTPQHPRLHDARPRQLRRVPYLDWPALLAVMQVAVERGGLPFEAALNFNERLFTNGPIPLGVEHSRATGPMPCALEVDMERARFARRNVLEMLNSAGKWEIAPSPETAELGKVLTRIHDRWRPLLQLPGALDGIGFGTLCRLGTGREWRYGREIPLATSTPELGGDVTLVKWLRKRLGRARISRELFEREVVPALPHLSDGGSVVEIVQRGNILIARISYSARAFTARIDSLGVPLHDPPITEQIPEPYKACPELEPYCRAVEIVRTPAHAWRRLGLILSDGTPTRRGIIFSFFNGGEGLAVAAALEDSLYPVADLVFDLANLRAGRRFAGDESPYGGRLGALCQKTYARADDPGYLDMGVPIHYGAGAAEIVRAIVEHGTPRQKLLTPSLRPGDIERAMAEWRSLLRHITNAPEYDWDRWETLRTESRRHMQAARAPDVLDLPPLLAAQMIRRG